MSIVKASVLISEIIESIKHLYAEEEAQAIAYRLLDLEFDCSKMDVYMGRDLERPSHWIQILDRLSKGEPFQYVIQKAFFQSAIFDVNEHTLIPRPETAELVDLVLDKIPTWKTNPCILDVGTGSGCIPISIKIESPQAQISAWDISPGAIEIAQKNAKKHQVEIHFTQQDVFKWAETTQFWDIIVSNPPYVLENEAFEMEKHVLEFEPKLALFVPNNDPLKYYKTLADFAINSLHNNGWLMLEINRAFGNETIELLKQKGFSEVALIHDFRDNPRFVIGKR
ncbi:peptide chain release factor N(5)-glutamine methyltransferase [Aquirufa sp. ROCK-SH2]